jgi:hypothetical protein
MTSERDASVLAAGEPRSLGVETPRLRFGEESKPNGAWAGRRLLWLDERPAFELSFWCGTCPFLFKRLEGANQTVSVAELEGRLADGVDALDADVIEPFASLVPHGQYLPMLLRVQPTLVRPAEPGDYFAEEQLATWGADSFWGLPQYPQTPYYRTYEVPVDRGAHLFEFLVPMVPPSWNDPKRVTEHQARLEVSSRPTAVAVATLDVCQPAVDDDSRDYFTHWAVTHFLLDGHHKVEAAANGGRSLQLLSLLSIDESLAGPDEVARVPEVRTRSRAPATAPARNAGAID